LPQTDDALPKPSRSDYVQALLKKRDDNLVKRLSENYRLKAFRFDRTDGATELLANRPISSGRSSSGGSAGQSFGDESI